MKLFFITLVFSTVAVLSACSQATPIIPNTGSIGKVIRQADQVEKGQSTDSLQLVEDTQDLLVNDILRVSRGGEGLLDFGDKMRLRLFNDTQAGLNALSAPGTPLGVKMFLERGGFTGQLTEPGGQAVFETPGGAKVTILGTRFFVVLDSGQQLTSVGNFDGRVQVEFSGTTITLQAGYFVDLPSGQQPGEQVRIPITFEEFEQWSRDGNSPLQAVARLRATATPSPTVTPEEPTSTPTPSITPTPTQTFTPTPTPPIEVILRETTCRLRPSPSSRSLFIFEAGQQVYLEGRSNDGDWLLVRPISPISSFSTCWVREVNVGSGQRREELPIRPDSAAEESTTPATDVTPTHTGTLTITPTPTGTRFATFTNTPTPTRTRARPQQTDAPEPKPAETEAPKPGPVTTEPPPEPPPPYP